jgi:hypothetical protein
MALNCKPEHMRQVICLKAPDGLPRLELEKLIMLQMHAKDKESTANGSNGQKKAMTAANVSLANATPQDASEEEEDADISAT